MYGATGQPPASSRQSWSVSVGQSESMARGQGVRNRAQFDRRMTLTTLERSLYNGR